MTFVSCGSLSAPLLCIMTLLHNGDRRAALLPLHAMLAHLVCCFVQNPAPESDWYEETGPGWSEMTARRWVHKLGNLCILNVAQNSGVSNSSFSNKKAILFGEPMARGLAAGLSAFGLADVAVWDPTALRQRHAFLIRGLATRWGVQDIWDTMVGADDPPGDDGDDDNGDEDGNDDSKLPFVPMSHEPDL